MPRSKRTKRSGDSRLRLHFLGAAGTVTGSLHFFEYTTEESEVIRFFVDAGLAQEDESLNYQNRLPSGLKASDIKFGIITHAHNDHTGFLPKLYKDGFRGPVYASPQTAALMGILLPDSGYLQEEEASRRLAREVRRMSQVQAPQPIKQTKQATLGRKGRTAKSDEKPQAKPSGRQQGKKHPKQDAPRTVLPALYTKADAEAALKLIKVVPFDQRFKAHPLVAFEYKRASHLLGAAVVVLEVGTGSKTKRIVISGDIGRPDMPVLKNIVRLKRADYVLCEATYGDRLHPRRDRQATLADHINEAHDRAIKKAHPSFGHGVILIPAFAVGRVQSVLFDLRQLMADGRIPEIPVFVDSPMAIKATDVYRKAVEEYNPKALAALQAGDPFKTPIYAELPDAAQSKKLDDPPAKPIIVLSSSGMASGGRVVHHLKQRLPGPQNTVLFAGFQSDGTLGRQLMNNKGEELYVGGEEVRVRAKIAHMEDYSGHGDYNDILNWLSGFSQAPKKVFLVHGDTDSLAAFKTRVEERFKWNVHVPHYREFVDLD
ncbi:MAG: MBL fold metallo-hydrolase [Candidatus Obscuribacterales bacterium]|nr:MBL fold metallo-hydrolase [Candidatus Obscuribacterales bacterium]